MKKWVSVFLMAVLLAAPVYAKEYSDVGELLADTAQVVEQSQAPTAQEEGEGEGNETPLEEPAPEPPVLPASPDIPVPVTIVDSEGLTAYSVTGSGYTGSISSTCLLYTSRCV